MSHVTAKIMWIFHNLNVVSLAAFTSTKLFCDNQVALHIASNLIFHERTKHIKVDCYFIHKKIHLGMIVIEFVNTEDQLVDLFIKALHRPLVEKFGMKDKNDNVFECFLMLSQIWNKSFKIYHNIIQTFAISNKNKGYISSVIPQ